MPDHATETETRWPRWAAAGLMAATLGWLAAGHVAALYGGGRFPPIDSRPWALLHDGLAYVTLAAGAVWYAAAGRRRSAADSQETRSSGGRLCLMAAFATALASTQLTLGMVLRYIPLTVDAGLFPSLMIGHLVNAGSLTVLTVLLAWGLRRRHAVRPSAVLLSLALLGVQLLLGAAMWVLHFYWPAWAQWLELRTQYTAIEARGLTQAIVISAHLTVGGTLAATFAGLTCTLFPGFAQRTD